MHDQWLNFITPGGFHAGAQREPGGALSRAGRGAREKAACAAQFQQYVSPEVIRRLLVNPGIVLPRKTEISVLFSDIRGFTTISEQLDAQELAALLNSYLTEMTRIIFKNRGTLDKYIGDAVMAFWGAPFDEPRHAEKSCRAALDMMARLRELQAGMEGRGPAGARDRHRN